MSGGFVNDSQKPTCSKKLKANPLPPPSATPVDCVYERQEASPNYLVPPPSLVTSGDGDSSSSIPGAAPPPPSTATDRDNGNHALPPFKNAFPRIYEQRFGHSENAWFPSGPDKQQGAYPHQTNSSRYHQPNLNTSGYQTQGSINNNSDFMTDHSYANRGPSTTDHQEKVHKPCMANEIFSFLKTCVNQLDVAMTNGPASSKLSSCVHVLQEISTAIINGENHFNDDLIHNGHKSHNYTYCGSGTLRQRNASTQVEQEPQTGNNIDTVNLSPPQNEAMQFN